jgi:O-antigen ligase
MIIAQLFQGVKEAFVDNTKRPLAIIGLLLFFLPSSMEASNVLIALLFVEAIIGLISNKKDIFFKTRLVLLIYILLFIVYVFSGIYSENRDWYIFEIEKKLGLLVLPLSFFVIAISKNQKRNLLTVFAFSTVFWLVFCLILSFFKAYQTNDYSYLYMDKLADWIGMLRVYFSLYIFFSLIILWHDYVDKRGNKTIVVTSMLLCVLGMFLFMSRIQLPVLFLFLCILMFQYFKNKGFLVSGILSLLVLGFIFGGLIYFIQPLNQQFLGALEKFHPKHAYTLDANGFNERLIFWKCSIELIKENIFFGVGIGDLFEELSACYTNIGLPRLNRFNCHNQYLQMWLSIGVFGFATFISLLIFHFKIAFKSKDSIYLAFLVVICLGFLTESLLELQRGIVFFILISLIFYCSNTSNNK